MSISSFPDIQTIKPKSPTISPNSDDDYDINQILQKYLNTNTPSYSSSYSSSCQSSPSTSYSSEYYHLFDTNDDTDSHDHTNIQPFSKYRINVPSIQIPSSPSTTNNSTTSTPSHSNTISPSIIDSDQQQSPSIIGSRASLTQSPSIILSSPDTTSFVDYDVTIPSAPIVSSDNCIQFDIQNMENKYFISSNGFDSGYHEWTIRVLKNDVYRQEIGIVSCIGENIEIGNYGGIKENNDFENRIVYGNILETNSFYNIYYDKNNNVKYNKNLSWEYCYNGGDEIKICLDLNKGYIKFVLNNIISTEIINIKKNIIYYPFVSFSGNCKYKIM